MPKLHSDNQITRRQVTTLENTVWIFCIYQWSILRGKKKNKSALTKPPKSITGTRSTWKMCFVKLGSQKLSKWCWNILCSPRSRALEVTCPQLAKKRTSAPQLKFRTAWCSDNNISKQIKPLTCSDPLPAQRLSHARATDPYLFICFNELDNFIVNFPPEQFFCFSSIIHWVQEHQLHTQLSQPERDSKEFVFSHSSFKYSCHYMSKNKENLN